MVIWIVGAGTMGAGLAETALASGHQVVLTDPDRDARIRAEERVRRGLARSIERGAIPETLDQIFARLTMAETCSNAQVNWVIEAALEDLFVKQMIFGELDQRFDASVWLASNTSSIAISRLKVRAVRHPERIGGLHFFNPVPRMALVEIIQADDTSPAFGHAARSLVQSLGKTAVMAPDRPGFLVNRIARPYYLEALRLVEDQVASLELVDQVMEGAGFPMGPFRVMDLVGVDVNLSVTQSIYDQTFGDERYRPHGLQQRLVERGHLGRKSGRGFYHYG